MIPGLAALAVALLVWPIEPALGHGRVIVSLRACGADGCRTAVVEDAQPWEGRRMLAPPVAPYYAVTSRLLGGREAQRGYFVPSARLVRWSGRGWFRTTPAGLAALDRAATGRPFPRPAVVRVRAGGRAVDEPDRYAAVYARLPRAAPPPGKRVRLRLEWDRPNPWDRTRPLEYVLGSGVVVFWQRPVAHDGRTAFLAVRLPPALAAPLDRAARGGGTRSAVVAVAVGLGGAGVLAAAAVLACRRRRA